METCRCGQAGTVMIEPADGTNVNIKLAFSCCGYSFTTSVPASVQARNTVIVFPRLRVGEPRKTLVIVSDWQEAQKLPADCAVALLSHVTDRYVDLADLAAAAGAEIVLFSQSANWTVSEIVRQAAAALSESYVALYAQVARLVKRGKRLTRRQDKALSKLQIEVGTAMFTLERVGYPHGVWDAVVTLESVLEYLKTSPERAQSLFERLPAKISVSGSGL